MSHFISLGLSFLICHTNTGSSALEQCVAVVNKYQPKEDNQRQHFLGQERDSTFSLQLQLQLQLCSLGVSSQFCHRVLTLLM